MFGMLGMPAMHRLLELIRELAHEVGAAMHVLLPDSGAAAGQVASRGVPHVQAVLRECHRKLRDQVAAEKPASVLTSVVAEAVRGARGLQLAELICRESELRQLDAQAWALRSAHNTRISSTVRTRKRRLAPSWR